LTGKESPRLYFKVETSRETRGITRKRIIITIILILILVIVIIIKIIDYGLV
jgi:hypothetical protein